jgi:hypothetical protein
VKPKTRCSAYKQSDGWGRHPCSITASHDDPSGPHCRVHSDAYKIIVRENQDADYEASTAYYKEQARVADQNRRKLEAFDELLEVAKIVYSMKAYLMFGKINAAWLQREVLEKHGATDFQDMAFIAYEKAEAAVLHAEEACQPV